ncbi:Hypothetical protein NTJ_04646 [Nesidiocoris tenuis]|uniref:Uncharacterized protein n=1 Tax=Nesidiocoris tenuis TaxID=355587 RepID=A0ABN7AN85_9HEMI|nr:Hypothetical protein NTJ_04646 [Nesidiocoris tenuis]
MHFFIACSLMHIIGSRLAEGANKRDPTIVFLAPPRWALLNAIFFGPSLVLSWPFMLRYIERPVTPHASASTVENALCCHLLSVASEPG